MTIITVSSSKGGTGKTTISGCLADYLAIQGNKVAVLDTDPNRNFSNWYNKKEGNAFDGVSLHDASDEETIIDSALDAAEKNDFVIIDVAGVSSKSLLYSAGVSNFVIIPSRPSEDDVIEAYKTHKQVMNAGRMSNRAIPCYVVLSCVKPGTKVFEHTKKQLKQLEMPLLKSHINERTIYQKARYEGTTPIRIEPSGAASGDISDMIDEITALINEKVLLAV